jgi:hypothetical protein
MDCMISRKQFFSEIFVQVARTTAQIWNGHPEDQPSPRDHCMDPAFTELCPSLMAMEAERLGADQDTSCDEDLRRNVYAELARRDTPDRQTP